MSRGKRFESARRLSFLPLSKLNTRNEGWPPTYHQRLVDATLTPPAAKHPTALLAVFYLRACTSFTPPGLAAPV
jgi:hypothetical protein